MNQPAKTLFDPQTGRPLTSLGHALFDPYTGAPLQGGSPQTAGINVGAAFDVGEWNDIGEGINEMLAAAIPRPRIFLPNAARPVVQRVDARLAQLQAAARQNRQLAPFAQMATNASNAAKTAMSAVAVQRVKHKAEILNTATHIIPVNFDAVLATSLSATATIKAPHQQSWRLLSIHTNDAQCTGIRFVNISIAGQNHVKTDNVEWSVAPTSPGIDFAIFSNKNNMAASHPQYRYRPWGLGEGGIFRPDGTLVLQAYNPTAATVNANVSLFVQSSPCGESWRYDGEKGGLHAIGSQGFKQFFSGLQGQRWWPYEKRAPR